MKNNIIGIICAMDKEARGIIERMTEVTREEISGVAFNHGKINGKDCVVAVCGIGLPARRGSPVLCIMPKNGNVCVRTYHLTHASWCELSDPERKDVAVFSEEPDRRIVIGPIVSIQRFCHSWRPGMTE